MIRPDILEVAQRYGEVRRLYGREYVTRSPCHDDRNPSGRLNPEKQVWYCDPCGRGGDVITFVQLAEKCSFKKACEILELKSYTPAQKRPDRRAAALLATWLNDQHLLIGVRLRELSQQLQIARQVVDIVESLTQEWGLLEVLHEDLQNPDLAAELWEARESIEAITADVEPDPLPDFPPLMDSYRAYLRSLPC